MSAPEIAVRVMRLATAADLPLPRSHSGGAAGLDLRAALAEELVLPPGRRALVPTGLRLAVPQGYEAQLRPRSGLARRGLLLPNAPATIDSDYRGELQVLVWNAGDAPHAIRRGDRIAQLVLAPVARIAWRECGELPETPRGAGGFGSTGER